MSGTEPALHLSHLSLAIGTQIEYHRPHEYATPNSLDSGSPGAGPVAPSGGRPPRRLSSPPCRHLRRTCPDACRRGTQQRTNTPGPPPYTVNPGPVSQPSPRHPTRPSHAGPNRQLDRPELAGRFERPPRPQEFFGKNSYARTTPRRPRPEPSSTRPSIIPASSAGTQRQPASQGLRATPSIPRPQPHRLVRPAQLTDHPSVPPDAEDSPIRRKKPPQAISGQPVPSGDRLARDSSPLLPQAAAGAHRRPTVTLTPRSPKAREGFAHGRRNHRSRG